LIAAAKRVFAEKGAAASLEQVAREADVSIATLYRHFPTRDELISAVYQQEVTTCRWLAGSAFIRRATPDGLQ
jgi:AcrR family transcriptional regulator